MTEATAARPNGLDVFRLVLANALIILFLLGILYVREFPILQHINRITGGLLVALFASVLMQYRVKIPLEVWLLGGFVIWSGVSGSVVAHSSETFLSNLRLMAQNFLLMFAITGLVIFFKDIKIPMIAVVVTAVLLLLSSWSSGEVYGAMEPNENTRLSGIVGNANLFGLLMLWGVMGLMFFWNVLKNTMARFFLMAGILPFIIAIIYSGSRKVFIVLNIFFVLWLLFTQRRFAVRRLGAFLLFLIIPFLLFFLTDYVFHNTFMGLRFQRAMDNPDIDTARSQMYVRGVDLFWENPLAGVGLGNFQVVSGLGAYSHSDYIEVASNTGIIGFILYFSIYGMILWRLLWLVRNPLPNDIKYTIYMFIIYIVSLLVLAFGDPNVRNPFVWFILSCIIGHSFRLETIIEARQAEQRLLALRRVEQP